MNHDDITRMADKAGFEICRGDGWPDERLIPKMMRFATLVAAAEREACAKVCDDLNFVDNGTPAGTRASNRHCAAAIRARGNT